MQFFKRLVAIIAAGLITCAVSANLLAQDYRFSVPDMDLQVFVRPDASVDLEYRIVFQNAPGAHVIDIVDVGLPHRRYNISNMSASIGGAPVTAIQKSTYIDVGVECHLGGRSIPAGGQGEFTFKCTMPDMVYLDSTDKTYASLQIVPTWFDQQSLQGRTKLQVAIHMLPGVDATAVKFQSDKFKYTDLVLFGDGESKHPVAIWQYDSWRLSSSNPKLAVSFPKVGMQRVVSMSAWQLFRKWLDEHPNVQYWSLAALGILFAIIFFRFSHGTGFVLFFILAAVIGFTALLNPALHLLTWPGMLGLFFLNERALKQRKQPKSYLPAMATVEGGGIKRGLTAPQAGVLLEMPMNKLLTLVVFGLIKKGVLEQTVADPLTVKVAANYAQPRKQRLASAGDQGVVIHDYEHAFIDRLITHVGPVKSCDLSEPVGGLIKSVASRMAGFDLSDTQAYYRAIIKRAWKEAESVGEIPQRDEVVDRNFEWILLDDHWIDIFGRWANSGRPYRPWWQRRGPVVVIDHAGGSSWGTGHAGGGSSAPPTPETAKTSLSEVAAGFAGWTENTMASFATAIEPARLGLDLPKAAGILDLSGVDRVTADVFKALAEAAASGNGGRGGGGGGCACACAGCACACACAGGGR